MEDRNTMAHETNQPTNHKRKFFLISGMNFFSISFPESNQTSMNLFVFFFFIPLQVCTKPTENELLP